MLCSADVVIQHTAARPHGRATRKPCRPLLPLAARGPAPAVDLLHEAACWLPQPMPLLNARDTMCIPGNMHGVWEHD